MGILEETATFATNFLTQILTIIGGIIIAAKYVIAENRKSHERLAKRILGDELDGKAGKGGLLDDLRTELRSEFKRDLESLEGRLNNAINDSHNQIINEFRRTSIKISYMSRDLGKIEKSLERMSGGRYTAAKEDVAREEPNFYDDLDNNGNNDDNSSIFDNDFNKKYRKGRKD